MPDIVLFVVDSLRFDRLGFNGHARDTSPALDRLAKQSVVFENAYASAPWTKPSIASIFTGLHATSHTVTALERLLPKSLVTLAERLKQAGYNTAGVVSHKRISREHQFDQGFDTFLDDHAGGHFNISTEFVINQSIESLETLSQQEAPFFLFIHLFDPHYFYMRHREYRYAGKMPDRIRSAGGILGLRELRPPATDREIQFLLGS